MLTSFRTMHRKWKTKKSKRNESGWQHRSVVSLLLCAIMCVCGKRISLQKPQLNQPFSNPRLQTLFLFVECMSHSSSDWARKKRKENNWLRLTEKSVSWNNQSSFQESLDFVKPLNYYSNFLLNSPFFARCCSKSANRFEAHPKIGLNLNTECVCLYKKRSSWNIHIQIHVI